MKDKLIKIATGARLAQRDLYKKNSLRNTILKVAAQIIEKESDNIISENNADIAEATKNGMSSAMIDRLRLTPERIKAMCKGITDIAGIPDTLGKGAVRTLSNGLKISQLSVPMGVVCMIYEARPNVTSDAAALCIKSGNAVILRGGKEALRSNMAVSSCFRNAALQCGVSPDIVTQVEYTDRQAIDILIKMNGYIDLLIPRGGKALINKVISEATVPSIETGAGNCHTYVSANADLNKALEIADNAKTSRPSVCNAMETLLVHEAVAEKFLPMLSGRMNEKRVELRLCQKCLKYIDGKLATETDYETEYNDLILAVKIVGSTDEAIAHISKYSTSHSEAIITECMEEAERFKQEIDAACVYVNASTRFTDGGEFGLGAEIGISTQKLHVRGPFGMEALVTYKYTIDGSGQIR